MIVLKTYLREAWPFSFITICHGYNDKLITFRFGIKNRERSILTAFSEDCHVQTNVHELAITRSSELRYLKGFAKQVYTRGSPQSARVFECKSKNRTSRIKTKWKICNFIVTNRSKVFFTIGLLQCFSASDWLDGLIYSTVCHN